MSCRKCGGENCGSSASSDGCDSAAEKKEKAHCESWCGKMLYGTHCTCGAK